MDNLGFTSELFDLDPLDIEDELDVELAKYYKQYRMEAGEKSEREHHNYIQEKASRSRADYMEIVSALLYGVLTEPDSAQLYFQSISLVNRDQYSMVFSRLYPLVTTIKFSNLKQRTKEQLVWLYNELTNLNIPNLEGLYLCLLRQIKGGDVTPPNIRLCDQVLKLLETHRHWLDSYPRLISTAVYTFLRLISEHRHTQFSKLQQREIRFVTTLLRQKWHICSSIGRDLIRNLHDVYHLPEFKSLWADLLEVPQKISPSCQGVEPVLKTPTPKEFLRSRLTPDMEHKLMYILQHLRIQHFQRNLGWFIQRFLSTNDAEPFYVDVIRFIVAGWYPNNQILQSDIVPRYVVIGSMIRSIKSAVVAANVKTALIYDWLFFTPNDNIMFIEPAMLLMERSAERYPYITATLMEFISHSISEYYKPMAEYMFNGIKCGMQCMLSKLVIRSLQPIYRCPATDDYTRKVMQTLFEEFLQDTKQPSQSSQQTLSSESMSEQAATTATDVDMMPVIASKTECSQPLNEAVTLKEESKGEEEDDTDKFLYGESDVSQAAMLAPLTENNENTNSNIQTPELTLGMSAEDNNLDDNANMPAADLNHSIAEAFTASTAMELDTADDTSAKTVIDNDAEVTQEIKVQTEADQPEHFQAVQRQGKGKQGQLTVENEEDSASDYPDENDTTEDMEYSAESAMQSHQSYWIFGDTLTRFKKACSMLLSPQSSVDDEEFSVQLIIAKRSFKDIMAVFLRMSIPADAFAPSISKSIVKTASRLILENSHTNYDSQMTDDDLIMDNTKDALDLLFLIFWNTKGDAATKEKMVQLISYLAHQCHVGKKHIIGMRWWLFVAGQLKNDTYLMTSEADDWSYIVTNCYEEYVLQHFDSSDEFEEKDYLARYLLKDLTLLSKYNIEAFHKILPFIYRRLSHVCIGYTGLIKLVSQMSLPSQIGELVCTLRFKSIRIFGNQFDITYLGSTFEKGDIYEASAVWQLLAAELQGYSDMSEDLAKSDFLYPLSQHFRLDLLPYLITVLCNLPPTSTLLRCIVELSNQHQPHPTARLQFSLLILQTWHEQSSAQLSEALTTWIKAILGELEVITEDSKDIYKRAYQLIHLLRSWWLDDEKSTDYELYTQDRTLMTMLSKAATTIGQSWPNQLEKVPRKKIRKVLTSSDEDSS